MGKLKGALIAVSMVGAAMADVRVVNGSFEEAKDGKPVGWRLASTCYSLEAGAGRAESSALVWKCNEPCKGGQSFLQDVTGWETGKVYRLSGWVRAENFRPNGIRGIKLSLNWHGADGKWIAGAYSRDFVESHSEWTRIRVVTRPIPPQARSLGLNCYVEKNCAGKVYFDDVTVEEVVDDPTRFDAIAALRPSVSNRPWWLRRFDTKKAIAENEDFTVAFVGDSITHNWETAGSNVWARHYADGPYKAINLGFAGDCTENVLWRLQHGQFGTCRPKAVVLMVGANNTGCRDVVAESALDTALGIKHVIEELSARLPEATVIVHPIFPRGATTNDICRLRNDRANQSVLEYLGRVGGERLLFCDFNAQLLGKDGVLTKEMSPDLAHLSERGYEVWAMALKPYLDFALGLSDAKPRQRGVLSAPTALESASCPTHTPIVKQHWIADCRRKGADILPDRRLTEKLAAVRGNRDHYYDVVMMGDSITHLFETGRGEAEWEHLSRRYKCLNLGFGGDGCQHLLWNALYGGFLDNLQTRVVTLMIGTNNRQASAEEVAGGIRLCVNAIRMKQPQAVVLLHPMIPRIDENLKWLREKNDRANELIKPLADGESVLWVDLRPIFEDVSAEKQREYLPDGTHPNAEAYRLWREMVTPYIDSILKRRKVL